MYEGKAEDAPSRGHDLKHGAYEYELIAGSDAPSRGHDLKQSNAGKM